jgi:hypothetical protein
VAARERPRPLAEPRATAPSAAREAGSERAEASPADKDERRSAPQARSNHAPAVVAPRPALRAARTVANRSREPVPAATPGPPHRGPVAVPRPVDASRSIPPPAPGRRVAVHIGAIEVKAPAPEPPAQEPAVSEPAGPALAPQTAGFDGYAAVRSYRL